MVSACILINKDMYQVFRVSFTTLNSKNTKNLGLQTKVEQEKSILRKCCK